MATSPISSLSSLPSTNASSAPTASSALGKDAFLKLLTTQLANQDPLQPMDSQAFVAQLAQFSSVEQLTSIGTRLDTLIAGQGSTNQLQAAGVIGKSIVYKADHVSLTQGSPATFDVSLDGASDATVAILADASGRVVRRLDLGARAAGASSVTWDGLDASGNKLPTGDYVLSVSATRKDGTAVNAAARIRGTVTGLSFENQTPELLVGGRQVAMPDVLEIDSTPTP